MGDIPVTSSNGEPWALGSTQHMHSRTHQLLQGLGKLQGRQARHALLAPVGQEALRIGWAEAWQRWG